MLNDVGQQRPATISDDVKHRVTSIWLLSVGRFIHHPAHCMLGCWMVDLSDEQASIYLDDVPTGLRCKWALQQMRLSKIGIDYFQ